PAAPSVATNRRLRMQQPAPAGAAIYASFAGSPGVRSVVPPPARRRPLGEPSTPATTTTTTASAAAAHTIGRAPRPPVGLEGRCGIRVGGWKRWILGTRDRRWSGLHDV